MKPTFLLVVTVISVVWSSITVAQTPAQDLFFDPETGITGNLTLVSDYLHRGRTLSDGKPALQGGFDYTQKEGMFLGTWLSSASEASPLEVDLYGGYLYSFLQDVDIIADLTGFVYPYATASNSLEASIAVDFHDVQIAYNYDFILEQQYARLAIEFSITEAISSELKAGLKSRKDVNNNRPSAPPDPPDEKQIWDVGFKMGYRLTEKSLLAGELVYHEIHGSSIAIGFTGEFSL